MNDLLLKITNLHLWYSSQQHISPLCVRFYLPAWSSLYMYGGFSVPQHCEVFPKQMHNGVVSCLPDIYFLPVNRTRWILHMNHIRRLLSTNVISNHFTQTNVSGNISYRCNTISPLRCKSTIIPCIKITFTNTQGHWNDLKVGI